MSGAEDGMNAFAVGRGAQGQQARLHHVKPFTAFLKEDLGDLRHFQIKAHRTRATVASSCTGLNGLTIHPVAPACFPASFRSVLDSVVKISMGTNL